MFEPLGDACGHVALQHCMLTGKLYVMLTCFKEILPLQVWECLLPWAWQLSPLEDARCSRPALCPSCVCQVLF